MKLKTILFVIAIFISTFFFSCGSLNETAIYNNTENLKLYNYKYVYIQQTSGITSSNNSGYMIGGIFVSGNTKTTNPSDLITGHFLKRGYTIIPEIKPDLANKTIIINYGESNRREIGFGYAIEITIKLIAADTYKTICMATAEGYGETEADDIRIAIDKAMNGIFETLK